MKKTFSVILLVTLLTSIILLNFSGCNNDGRMPTEPTTAWKEALEKYLTQFLPVFHNVRYEELSWWSGWISDWSDFVERCDGDFWPNHGYGYTYHYRDPLMGERLVINDVPYLNQRSGSWYDDNGEIQFWSRTEIATGFELFDFDNTGIPELVIYWSVPTGEPAQPATLHRFHNGAYEFVKEISSWELINFYRADNGMIFIDYISTVAHMLDVRLMQINDEIIITPVISTDGWTGTLYNHLTGERFLKYTDGSMRWEGLSTENRQYRREEMLGMSLTIIEPLEVLQNQLIKSIIAQCP